MHSSLTRVQNVFGFFTTVIFVFAALIASTDFLAPRTPSADVFVKDLQVALGRPHYYSPKKEEYASIKFSLSADFSSLFHWNTKQVFVYVSATWPDRSATNRTLRTNEAVIWDTIITSPTADHLQNIGPAAMKKLVKSAKGKAVDPNRGKIELRNQRPKYQITAPSGTVAEVEDMVLQVHYNVQPWVGVLTWTQEKDFLNWETVKGGISKVFKLPALKKKDEKKNETKKPKKAAA